MNDRYVLDTNVRLKLSDAIVCATALVMDATLLSNDVQLGKVTELTLNSVQIQPNP